MKFVQSTSEVAIAVKFAAGELRDDSYYRTFIDVSTALNMTGEHVSPFYCHSERNEMQSKNLLVKIIIIKSNPIACA